MTTSFPILGTFSAIISLNILSGPFYFSSSTLMDFPGGSDGKASVYNVGDPGSIPVMGRSPGKGNGNPLQCSYLENPRDGGAWWTTVHGVTKGQTPLGDFTYNSSSLPVPL